MRSGRLKHRLVLQSPTETRNSYGESVRSWSTEATVWGAIEPLSGKEFFSQQTINAEVKVRIVIRYYAGLLPTWRVTNGGLYYAIDSVINHDTADRQMTLMCLEGVIDDEVVSTTLQDVAGNDLTFVSGDTWDAVV